MLTAKYSDFLAEIFFEDTSYVTFDGPKDMFKYYFNMERYDKKRNRTDIEAVYVTEYYRLVLIDARSAYFVVGSDVRGPMGDELIAFETAQDAQAFNKDHKGKSILGFDDVTPETLKRKGS